MKLIDSIDASRLSDLDPNKIESYRSGLITAGKSHRTHNQHRATVVSFAEWCYEQGRIASKPLQVVPTLNEAKDMRCVRRAMTEDELSRLMAASDSRRPYYLFAYDTGLRVKAAKAAMWGDIDFDAASIRVRVGNAKGKKEDIWLPLHPKLVDELSKIKPTLTLPATRIFQAVPSVRTFHRDCERANIDRYDADGRQFDRHALRTTLRTHLARGRHAATGDEDNGTYRRAGDDEALHGFASLRHSQSGAEPSKHQSSKTAIRAADDASHRDG